MAISGTLSESETGAGTIARSGYLVSPLYDWVFFIGSPLIALAIGLALAGDHLPWLMDVESAFGTGEAWTGLFIAVWTYAHLCAVVFRSHVNREIFSQFKLRFTVVPAALFVAFCLPDWMLISGLVLAVFWDIYHTSMQNFGFCRIYDAKHGSPPERGRKLDMMINHVLYIGPIIGGLSFAATLKILEEFTRLGWYEPVEFGAILVRMHPHLTSLVIALGGLFAVYYFWFLPRISAV